MFLANEHLIEVTPAEIQAWATEMVDTRRKSKTRPFGSLAVFAKNVKQGNKTVIAALLAHFKES